MLLLLIFRHNVIVYGNGIRIISAALLLFSVFMGTKHGVAMVMGKASVVEMFGKWNINKKGVQVLGVMGLIATLFLLFPKTFVLGNLITAALILFMMVQFLKAGDRRGFLIELPFFLLPFLLIYLQHPLTKAVE